MPGITGIYVKKTLGDEEIRLHNMVGAMLNESFYTHGFYINQALGFYIGYVAIRDSFSDCMPIWNEEKSLVMFLTGESYVDQAGIEALREGGHEFNPHDGSFLIHLFEEDPEGFWATLNGWLNGVIIDLKAQQAFLFNDRYGIRRVYYHESIDGFFFSSEAKSLLKVIPALREINLRSVGEFLTYDCVLENRTYFRGMELLPPGSCWQFGQGESRKRTYFVPRSLENQKPLSLTEFFQELSSTFERIVPRYFHGKVGMSLTGGLDTRMIMAGRNAAPGELPCYTFAGSYRDTLDVRLAKRVAETCCQPHHILRLDDERFLAEYPSHLQRSIYFTDGLEATDAVDVICLNKLARDIAPARMTGKYGSQVLKSLSGFKARPPERELFDPDFAKYLDLAKLTCEGLERKHNLSAMLSQEIPWWWNGFVASESTQVSVRSPFLDNDLISVLYQAPSRAMDFGSNFQVDFIRKRNPKLMTIPTNRGLGGSSNPLVSYPIRWIFQLLNTADKLYIREELPFSLTHVVARCDYLLSSFSLDRIIMGFGDHRRYRIWFRDQLAEFLQDTLLSTKALSRPYWNKPCLERVVNGHINGRGTYLREIRKALQIEMIHRILLERAW
jgi:asparagine synthase (glutamine-hydrolysing)